MFFAHAINATSTSLAMSMMEDDDDRAEHFAIGISVLVVVVLWVVVHWNLTSSTEEDSSKGATPAERVQLLWLGALATGSFVQLAVQLGLAMMSGSLTLIADMGHSCADVVSYIGTYVVESYKVELRHNSNSDSQRTVARLDAISGLLSCMLVAGTSAHAAVDAVRRLRGGSGPDGTGLIGFAMLIFSCFSTAVNATLLAARYVGPLAPPDQPSELQPLLASGVQPPPPPVPSGGRGRPRRGRNRGMQMLHDAFHPGCQDPGCNDDNCERGDGANSSWSANLNVYGALLHLATDVIRSIVVLVAGLLLQGGLVRDAARADAVCALVVGFCVFAGSSAFMSSSLSSLQSALSSETTQTTKTKSPGFMVA
jgi:Co/Zn/Cd efflux system component